MAHGAYELFWENSTLSRHSIAAWRRRVDDWAAGEHDEGPSALRFAGADIALPAARDGLQRTMGRRASQPRFGASPLTLKQLGRLLGACGRSAAGRRTYASAGATYPVEIFCLPANVSAPPPLDASAWYYNADNHSLSVVGPLAPWADWSPDLNLDTAGTVPGVVVVLAIFPERITAKYGDRGGRFALVEVGHVSQNLALRAARDGLAGVELGGIHDEAMRSLLGLTGTTAQIALGYAVGAAS